MFRFKQFTIQQDRTAMKVCTDACVLGASADVADCGVPGTADRVSRILDIGTGTGLLALMAAQRNLTAQVDAIEVDDAAFVQAKENVAASPFAGRVRVVHRRVQDFYCDIRYDRIMTNPPFYTNHLRSPDAAVSRALHTDELPFSELVEAVARLMQPDGQWWVLLPPYEAGKLAELAKKVGLRPFKRLSMRHHAQKAVFRVITGFAFEKSCIPDETLDIYEFDEETRSGGTYTVEFRALLRDFYLIF
ncbi:tRNA1(Val) (adenine(37)-N6)-methyltransferase [Spirosoma flavum]|uniref:tRNA1(Val) (adenine(37)-N6)-methyltransferase n=1 Tax=Spirosoma flavum TaxID=2048557 RepID=A0ABW6AIF7_9BACT